MGELATEARRAGLPLVLQPNAGQPRLDGGGFRYEQEPERFAEEMAALCSPEAGAGGGRIAAVGGCCGTDPRFIAALRDALRRSGNREA
jgi:5-methyltetrahydrofolate--homocysteine methyltransferase